MPDDFNYIDPSTGSMLIAAKNIGGIRFQRCIFTNDLGDGIVGTNTLLFNAAGVLKVDNSGVTQPVSGAFFPATQPISLSTGTNTLLVGAGGTLTVLGPLTNTELRATPVNATATVNTYTGGLTDAQLRATPVPVNATATVNTYTGGLTDAQLRATPVNTTATVNTYTGGLTNTELRAVPVPVSGPLSDTQLRLTPINTTATVNTYTGGLTNTELRATPINTTATVNTYTGGLTNAELRATPVPVSGAFYQITQPVSGAVQLAATTANTYIGNVKLTDGTTTALMSADGSQIVIGPKGRPKVLGVSGSIGVLVAATWSTQVRWAVPANYVYKPKVCHANVTTAGSRTLIMAGQKLGTWNENTNAFTDSGTSVAAPDFYDRLFARVTTTHAATANTITVTYADQDAAGSTATIAMPATSLAAENWVEGVLAAGDYGIQDISAVSDSAAPATGVIELWGLRTLAEFLGPANNTELVLLGEGIGIPNGESIVVLFNAAATTAQQRSAHVSGDLVSA
jgi:hypothetical protein